LIQFFSALDTVINRKHSSSSLAETRENIKKLCEATQLVVKRAKEGASKFSEENDELCSFSPSNYPSPTKVVSNIDLQTDIILYTIGLVKSDFSYIEAMACRFGFFEKKLVNTIYNIFFAHRHILFTNGIKGLPEPSQDIQNLEFGYRKSHFDSNRWGNHQEKHMNALEEEFDKIKEKVGGNGEADKEKSIYRVLFEHFDDDKSGYIDYEDFWEIFKYMGLYIGKERTIKLFAKTDENNNGTMEFDEFEYAMSQLKKELTHEALQRLNETGEELVWIAVSALVFLLLLFIFIFIWISAFSRASEFNAIVSSILPMSAGLIASLPSIGISGKHEKIRINKLIQ
jgi:hypothetical protein